MRCAPLEYLPAGGLVEFVVDASGSFIADRAGITRLDLNFGAALHQQEEAHRRIDRRAHRQQTVVAQDGGPRAAERGGDALASVGGGDADFLVVEDLVVAEECAGFLRYR